jgi:hypothetical protein
VRLSLNITNFSPSADPATIGGWLGQITAAQPARGNALELVTAHEVITPITWCYHCPPNGTSISSCLQPPHRWSSQAKRPTA